VGSKSFLFSIIINIWIHWNYYSVTRPKSSCSPHDRLIRSTDKVLRQAKWFLFKKPARPGDGRLLSQSPSCWEVDLGVIYISNLWVVHTSGPLLLVGAGSPQTGGHLLTGGWVWCTSDVNCLIRRRFPVLQISRLTVISPGSSCQSSLPTWSSWHVIQWTAGGAGTPWLSCWLQARSNERKHP
jgi:hypothetical protein